MTKEKREALRLLKKYDKLRAELRAVEPQLNKACADYGRSIGAWGYRPDHLRMEVARAKNKQHEERNQENEERPQLLPPA